MYKSTLMTVFLISIFCFAYSIAGCSPSPDAQIPSTLPATESVTIPKPTISPTPTPLPTPTVRVDMILIPSGEFIMGGDAKQAVESCQELYEPYGDLQCEIGDYDDEEPIHSVSLDEYSIDKYEVTNADYQICVNEGVCAPPKYSKSYTRDEYFGNPEFDNYPVIYVSWFDAQTFCEWRGARLPTEAEWEKAARGTEGWIYPWGNQFDGNLGNFCDRDYEYNDGFSDTAPVGIYPEGASPYGVMDMAGNVIEWVSDRYGDDYFSNSPDENPQGPPKGCCNVLKGGTWKCDGKYDVRASGRSWWFPDYKYDFIGFRCAASVVE
jgi:serine/threonine-protein kinase